MIHETLYPRISPLIRESVLLTRKRAKIEINFWIPSHLFTHSIVPLLRGESRCALRHNIVHSRTGKRVFSTGEENIDDRRQLHVYPRCRLPARHIKNDGHTARVIRSQVVSAEAGSLLKQNEIFFPPLRSAPFNWPLLSLPRCNYRSPFALARP